MTSTLLAHTALLALDTTDPNPTGPEFGKASPLGLVIILVLLAGTVLLVRSMNKHIKRLPASFSREGPEADQEADDGTDHGVADPGADPEADSERESKPATESETSPSTESTPDRTDQPAKPASETTENTAEPADHGARRAGGDAKSGAPDDDS